MIAIICKVPVLGRHNVLASNADVVDGVIMIFSVALEGDVCVF
jgi:hypothetical protein